MWRRCWRVGVVLGGALAWGAVASAVEAPLPKGGSKPVKTAKKPAETKVAKLPKVPPVLTPLPLGDEELAVAGQVYVGDLPCELGQRVSLHPDEQHPGYFHLALKQHRFHMQPVVTTTGAVRLEDPKNGALWIQVANKSMLMSQKEGRRLADDCMSPVQQAAADAMKANATPGLLDVAKSQP